MVDSAEPGPGRDECSWRRRSAPRPWVEPFVAITVLTREICFTISSTYIRRLFAPKCPLFFDTDFRICRQRSTSLLYSAFSLIFLLPISVYIVEMISPTLEHAQNDVHVVYAVQFSGANFFISYHV